MQRTQWRRPNAVDISFLHLLVPRADLHFKYFTRKRMEGLKNYDIRHKDIRLNKKTFASTVSIGIISQDLMQNMF